MPSHPQTAFAPELEQPADTARALGYRMPAEWEPMQAVWVSPPHNPETWPGCLEQARDQFDLFTHTLKNFVTVSSVDAMGVATNDSWIRDFGPIFVVNKQGELACHDFHFNGWGGKYEVRDLDDVVPQHVAKKLGVPLWMHDMVLEGGSIDVNGAGTVMTTEQCLLNKNRNPDRTREQIIEEVHDAIGTWHAIWLPGGIIGDDTDGHIDDIARFVNANTVVGLRAPAGHPDAQMLNRNWDALTKAKDQDGSKLNLFELPVPKPIMYNFPADRFGEGGINPVPASYANFVIANGAVLVPIFNQPTDDVALATLEKAMPGHKIIGIAADLLVVGLGAFHCLSQQQPKAEARK